MNPTMFEQEIAINRKAYEALREQIRRDHAGQYIALTHGQVIAATPTYEEAEAAIERLRPVPECYFIFPAEEEPIFEVIDNF